MQYSPICSKLPTKQKPVYPTQEHEAIEAIDTTKILLRI